MSEEEQDNAPFYDVDPREAARAIEAGEVRVIDVREQFEWDRGHIAGATLIPLNSTAQQSGMYGFAQKLKDVPEDKPILFVCAGGGRSAQAAEIAAVAGRSNLYNMSGGMQTWMGMGLPTER